MIWCCGTKTLFVLLFEIFLRNLTFFTNKTATSYISIYNLHVSEMYNSSSNLAIKIFNWFLFNYYGFSIFWPFSIRFLISFCLRFEFDSFVFEWLWLCPYSSLFESFTIWYTFAIVPPNYVRNIFSRWNNNNNQQLIK